MLSNEAKVYFRTRPSLDFGSAAVDPTTFWPSIRADRCQRANSPPSIIHSWLGWSSTTEEKRGVNFLTHILFLQNCRTRYHLENWPTPFLSCCWPYGPYLHNLVDFPSFSWSPCTQMACGVPTDHAECHLIVRKKIARLDYLLGISFSHLRYLKQCFISIFIPFKICT